MMDKNINEHQNASEAKSEGTLLVVDGHSLAFRAFYALPAENFTTSTGEPTNAVWGFATMLAQVLDNESRGILPLPLIWQAARSATKCCLNTRGPGMPHLKIC